MRRGLGGVVALLAALCTLATAHAAGPERALAEAYVAEGGYESLGRIVTPGFRIAGDPRLYLATERAVLAATAEGVVERAAVTAWITSAHLDPWADVVLSIPAPASGAASELLVDGGIAAHYRSVGVPEAQRRWGEPRSMARDYGPFVSQRFERAVLQRWTGAAAGGPPEGTITEVLMGRVLTELGLLPTTPMARLPPGVRGGDILTARPNDRNEVAITFDMGSIDDGLAGVLDALRSRDLQATFFVTAAFLRYYPGALESIRAGGHEIAHHSDTHPDFRGLDGAGLRREVDLLEAYLAAQGVPGTAWFRPPFGGYDRRVQSFLSGRGYPLVMWRLDLADWRAEISAADVISIGRRIRSGDIVVTHGGLPKTAQAIGTVLDELRARGLKQVTLRRLYTDPAPSG